MSSRKRNWKKMYEEGERNHLKRMKKEFGRDDVAHYNNIFVRSDNPNDIVHDPTDIEDNWNKQLSSKQHQSENKGCFWTFFGCFGMIAFVFMIFVIVTLYLSN